MPIRPAELSDLPAIVGIYNASIPGRMATADTAPVTVQSRKEWFREFNAEHPLWVYEHRRGEPLGWLSLRSFYGRPAYRATVEVAVYVAPATRRQGIARRLLEHALVHTPELGVSTLLAFVFAHNDPSTALFESYGFNRWGHLPRVAEIDGVERDLLILGRRVDGGK